MEIKEAEKIIEDIDDQAFMLSHNNFKPCGILVGFRTRQILHEAISWLTAMTPVRTENYGVEYHYMTTRFGDVLQIHLCAELDHPIEVVGRIKREGEI